MPRLDHVFGKHDYMWAHITCLFKILIKTQDTIGHVNTLPDKNGLQREHTMKINLQSTSLGCLWLLTGRIATKQTDWPLKPCWPFKVFKGCDWITVGSIVFRQLYVLSVVLGLTYFKLANLFLSSIKSHRKPNSLLLYQSGQTEPFKFQHFMAISLPSFPK